MWVNAHTAQEGTMGEGAGGGRRVGDKETRKGEYQGG